MIRSTPVIILVSDIMGFTSLSEAKKLLASSERTQQAHPEIFAEVNREFKIGVALHTRKVAYGGMSQGEFTLVGDSVNLTFRLETLTRTLKKPVLESGDFMRELPNARTYGRGMGVHKVKGRAQGVEAHAITQFPES